jgi:hypothetical protein
VLGCENTGQRLIDEDNEDGEKRERKNGARRGARDLRARQEEGEEGKVARMEVSGEEEQGPAPLLTRTPAKGKTSCRPPRRHSAPPLLDLKS